MTIVEGLDWVFDTLMPAFFYKFNNWMIAPDVSILGFSVAVVVVCIVVGAMVLRA